MVQALTQLVVYEGSQFRKLFAELAIIHGVGVEKTGVESHNSLGIVERNHKYLRDTYLKLKIDYPNMQRQMLLALATKAINDTLGPEGIVPSSLVFGEFPILRSLYGPIFTRPTLAECARTALDARRLMSRHLAQAKVTRAQRHNTPPATNATYQTGDLVLVWREKVVESRVGQWLGPYTVVTIDVNAEIVIVRKDKESLIKSYNMVRVKTFLAPTESSTVFMDILYSVFVGYASNPTCMRSSANVFQMHVTEIIEKDDLRAKSHEMQDAIRNEVRDLTRRGTFKVILKEELADGANSLKARFVLGIKSNTDGEIKFKARHVIGGHRDHLKYYMVHGAQTMQPSSTRLLLTSANAFDFGVWSTDVKLAYLESSEPLKRCVFIHNPAPEFVLEPSECFELLKPLYGLRDAGDLWHQALKKHLVNDVNMKPTKPDPSLLFAHDDSTLTVTNGSYVDDMLRAGNSRFRRSPPVTHKVFETSGDDELPFDFAGLHIKALENESLSIGQEFYQKKLEELHDKEDFLSSALFVCALRGWQTPGQIFCTKYPSLHK